MRVIVVHPKASPAGVMPITRIVPAEAFIPCPPAPITTVVRDDTQSASGVRVLDAQGACHAGGTGNRSLWRPIGRSTGKFFSPAGQGSRHPFYIRSGA